MSTVSKLTLAQHAANAKTVYAFWRGVELSHGVACGFVANADAESSIDPTLIGDNGKAFGLHQWHMDRVILIRDGGQGYKGCGIDVSKQTDLADQLKAAWWELQHSEHHALGLIRGAASAHDAGATICRYWERSGLADQPSKRGARAETWDSYFVAQAKTTGA